VDGGQDGGVGRRIVEQDYRGRQGEGAGRDLEEDDKGYAEPDVDAAGGVRALGRRGEEGDVWGEEVG